jgi:hypothetical protein
MAVSLYDLSVTNYLQTLGGVEGFLAKGAEHLKGEANAMVDQRLIGDMLPFKFQVWAVAHHSIGAIKGMKAALFTPPSPIPDGIDYAGLQKAVSDAKSELEEVSPAEVNALDGKDMVFQIRDMKMPFTTTDFVQSFSLPNFYFHATTAYDMLRQKGVPIGKRDYLGRMRLKK